jgi:hypothetical protein
MMPEDARLLLEWAGVRPVMVDGLGKDAVLYLADGVLLVDATLSLAAIESVVRQSIAAAVRVTP